MAKRPRKPMAQRKAKPAVVEPKPAPKTTGHQVQFGRTPEPPGSRLKKPKAPK